MVPLGVNENPLSGSNLELLLKHVYYIHWDPVSKKFIELLDQSPIYIKHATIWNLGSFQSGSIIRYISKITKYMTDYGFVEILRSNGVLICPNISQGFLRFYMSNYKIFASLPDFENLQLEAKFRKIANDCLECDTAIVQTGIFHRRECIEEINNCVKRKYSNKKLLELRQIKMYIHDGYFPITDEMVTAQPTSNEPIRSVIDPVSEGAEFFDTVESSNITEVTQLAQDNTRNKT